MDLYIGKTLDERYEIMERIGTGGMAVVYKAMDHRLNRLVAVKILKSDLAQDEDFRRRFNAESQAVAQLSHPNIVSVFDVSKGGDTEYIVMELIDGITLKQYMEKRGQLSWRESLHFITQIMRALSHAHSRGIVHRDIKPQNIMVLRDGSVKVADFGIACLENAAQTLTQEALGSVHYISPEQARGDRTDSRSDIYSAGVVLYELLTNRLPFEGDSAVSVAIQHLSSIPLAPREINPDIPEQLQLICMKAMAPDLNRRYASADEMIADLESFRKNPGVDLDFGMEDIRPQEPDEPTQLLRTVSAGEAAAHRAPARPVRPVRERPERRIVEEEPYREPAGNRLTTTLMVIIAILVALIVAVLLFRGIFDSFREEVVTYTVPKVTGYTVEQAKGLAEVRDVFTIVETGSEASDEPVGTIIEQDPVENTQLKTDLIIRVIVSAGEQIDYMPDLVKKEAREAQMVILKDLIEKYGLTVKVEEEPSDTINDGYIIRTEPVADTELHKGDTIILYKSIGRTTTKVSSFLGQNINDVRPTLESVWNLTFGGTTSEVSSQPAGTILDQEPKKDAEVPIGTPITFIISSGPTPEGGEKTVHLEFPLPSDRAETVLRIELDGELFFEETVNCAPGSAALDLKGSGTMVCTYYWDGELQGEPFEIPFS